MSGSSQKNGGFSRRAVTIGGSIAAALGIAALGVSVPRWLAKNYAKSRYDDLFALLMDRESAVKVGHAAIETMETNGGPNHYPPDYAGLANDLRHRLSRRTLADVTASDLAEDKLLEVQGWVLPQTLVLLSVLAASVES